MKIFIGLSVLACMVAAAIGALYLQGSESSADTVALTYSQGSNVAYARANEPIDEETTLLEPRLESEVAGESSGEPPAAPTVEPQVLDLAGPASTVEPTPEPTLDELAREATATPTATPTPTPTPEPTPEPTQEPAPAPSGSGLLGAINALRSSFGLSPLGTDSALSSAARAYCQTVGEYHAQTNSLSHTIGGSIGDRLKSHGFSGSGWGETLAWTADPASESLFDEVADMWRNSSGHNALLYQSGTAYGGKSYTVAGAASCTVNGTGFYVVDVGTY